MSAAAFANGCAPAACCRPHSTTHTPSTPISLVEHANGCQLPE
jgi:hypothetical protein